MKKILEYKVFDLLKDKENEKFLDKVKKENPDLYAKFLNILGNKGLEIAKQKYQEFDPEYKKQKLEEEKKEKARLKSLGRKKAKEEFQNKFLMENDTQIKEIENVLSKGILHKFYNVLMSDKRINQYLSSYHAKKEYKNKFKEFLKKPIYLRNAFGLNINMHIDSLLINYITNDWYDDEKYANLIKINQYYNLEKKELTYSIYFYIPDDDFRISKIDADKERSFLSSRKDFIEKMNKSGLTITELYDTINKFSAILDERVYQKWYEEWKKNKTIGKYNL